MRISIAIAVAALISAPAVPSSKFALTIDNIMRGPGLVGYEPSNVRWSGDGERIYFQWKQASDPIEKDPDTYFAARAGGAPQKLTEAEAKLAPPAFGDLSKDRKRIVYTRDGDIFVYDNSSGQTQQITKTEDAETNPRWLPDGKRMYFTRGNNLYVMSLDGGSLTEMTDIRPPGSPSPSDEEKKGTDSQEYLKKEEKSLLEVVRERAAKREEDEAKKKRENPRKPFLLQARQSVAELRLSPDEKYVTALIEEAGEKTKKTIVANFVTESAYTEDISSRDKVGDVQTRRRLAILNVETGEAKWMDLGEREPGGVRDREATVSPLVWSEDGTRVAILAHANDNKDRWVMALDLEGAKARELAGIHDDDWVDGPGSFTLGWLKGDREVYFQSERTGYSHLYKVSFEGGEPVALTSGQWEVLSAVLSNDKSKFFLTTSEADPGEHQIYEMSAEGGERVRLTSLAGQHRAVLSPDERWMADVYSYTNKPPEVYVQETAPGAAGKKLTWSPSAEFAEYPWMDTPIVTFPARDGAMLRAQLYKPANFRKGGPAVVFVHGAGYLQNVHRGWSSSYYHEYLFHHFLMEHGYTVLAIDYRGSAGYGRDWRTGIYRHMGGTDLDDNVDGARWLVSHEGVDAKRIGIYGGSYGGFITLMAMFTQPDVFAAGAALRPVTDWAHYNHGYTSNILNLPQKDEEAYRKSSPIYFAQGLKGALLICHGMVDTNVHFQDTVRLIQRLIELRKENWEVAVYPVENHGFVQPTSWADEYKRIFALFEKNLKR